MKSLFNILTLAGVLLLSCDDNDEAPGFTETRLDYYTESFEIAGFDFDPQYTVMYHYDNSGKLEKYTFYSFDPSSDDLKEERTFVFAYLDGRVNKIEGFLVNQSSPYITYLYEYLADSRVTSIRENNLSAGITSQASFHYLDNDTIRVTYEYSNGNGFEYKFYYGNQNIITDETTRGAQLCSEGLYSYDDHKSPFQTLGYVDYLLFNMSVNNKLTESVSYVACSFPTLVPESYQYEYGDHGFPEVMISSYKTGGVIKHSKRNYFYKQVSVK